MQSVLEHACRGGVIRVGRGDKRWAYFESMLPKKVFDPAPEICCAVNKAE